MTNPYVLEDLAMLVEDQQAFIASASVGSRRSFGIATEVSHEDSVSMVFELFIVAPKLAAGMVPQRISNKDLIATITINVKRIREVSGLAMPLPQQLKIFVQDPEIGIAVLDQDVAAGI